MERYEYMRIPLFMFPAAIIEQYNLLPLVHNEHVFVEIQQGIYGLPQAGRVANNQLVKFMAPQGYHAAALTPGLWTHASLDIIFSLVVDDFGVRYTLQTDADHLLATLERHYHDSVDWTGARYYGSAHATAAFPLPRITSAVLAISRCPAASLPAPFNAFNT
jgi:hypothetical protein